MKALILFAAASFFAGPLLAADDLCSANLQKIDDQTLAATLGDPLEQQIETLREAASHAQMNDDVDGCVIQSGKALQLLETSNKDDGGGAD